jgi:flagellar motor switch protein FliM
MNPSLIFPILEMLLGGAAKHAIKINREITEIEQSILDSFYRIILHDLRSAWQVVAGLDFSIECHETEPQLLQILAPNEAVVAVSMEVRVGDHAGMMNIGIPSIIVKMLRHKFDQQWSVRRTQSTEKEQNRVLKLIKPSPTFADARLTGPTVRVEDLMAIQEGDLLTFDYPIGRQVHLLLNGQLKFEGHVVSTGRKRGFEIDSLYKAAE